MIAFIALLLTSSPVEVERLENGLTIIYCPKAEASAVAVSLRYPIGSIHDPQDRAGLAHLLEHLMFQETKNLGPGELHAKLEAVGAVNINAHTTWGHTEYHEVLPKDELALALSLESERMTSLLGGLNAARIEQEKRVVANELYERLYDAPYGFFEHQVFERLYPGQHPLHFGPIGTLEQIEAITKSDLAAFYKKNYGPRGATLVLVGGFELEKAKELARKYFSEIPAQPEPGPVPLRGPRRPKGSINGPAWGAGKNRLTLLWPLKKEAPREALEVFGAMLSYGRVSRAGLANLKDESIHSVRAGLLETPANSFFRVDAMIAPGMLSQLARDRVRGMIETYVSYAPQKKELQGAKRRMTLDFLRSLESLDGQARVLLAAHEELKDARRFMEYPKRWANVSPRVIQNAISRHLSMGAVVAVAHPVRLSR